MKRVKYSERGARRGFLPDGALLGAQITCGSRPQRIGYPRFARRPPLSLASGPSVALFPRPSSYAFRFSRATYRDFETGPPRLARLTRLRRSSTPARVRKGPPISDRSRASDQVGASAPTGRALDDTSAHGILPNGERARSAFRVIPPSPRALRGMFPAFPRSPDFRGFCELLAHGGERAIRLSSANRAYFLLTSTVAYNSQRLRLAHGGVRTLRGFPRTSGVSAESRASSPDTVIAYRPTLLISAPAGHPGPSIIGRGSEKCYFWVFWRPFVAIPRASRRRGHRMRPFESRH